MGKKAKVIFVVTFILLAGIIYTIFTLQPWREEPILLETTSVSEQVSPIVTDETIAIGMEVSEETVDNETIIVHICGAVKEPGVYELSIESRLMDVVKLAGGLTQDAEDDYVNLAQELLDGCQYYIPTKADMEENQSSELVASLIQSTSSNKSDNQTEQTNVVNINKATQNELMTLPGVGKSKAEAIITYRETVANYETVEDIMKVTGIKEGLFQKICNKISVN